MKRSLTALILAGGKGSRLEPWHAPKCLLPINGVPIIHHLIEHLSEHACDVILCVGYKAHDVIRAVKSFQWPTVYPLDNGSDAAMCARLLEAYSQLVRFKDDLFIVCYGDELADVHIPSLLEHHTQSNSEITITAFNQRIPFGVVDYEVGSGRLKGIDEEVVECINIGFAILEPQAFARMRSHEQFSEFIKRVAEEGVKVGVYIHQGRRTTINNPSDIAAAEEAWK